MRAVDEANTEARRPAIITAAIRCLSRSGIAKTSIGDICKEAGMRSSHLYYYFDSKDALLAAIMTLNQDRIADRIEHMLEGEGDLATKIFDVHIDAELQRSALGLTPILRMELECYFSREDYVGPERFSGERLIVAIHNAVRQGIAEGQLPNDIDVIAFGKVIALIWQGLTHNRLSSNFDVEDHKETVRMILAPWFQWHHRQ